MAEPQRDAPGPMFAWMVFDHDGRWGLVAAAVLHDDPIKQLTSVEMAQPLVTRDRKLATSPLWRRAARAHAQMSGKPVRLFRFESTVALDYA